MTQCKQDVDMKGVDSALGDLVAAQLGLGKELLKVLGAGSALLFDGAKGLRLPAATNCCDIPDPCWMPKSLGDVSCQLMEGDTARFALKSPMMTSALTLIMLMPPGQMPGRCRLQAGTDSLRLGQRNGGLCRFVRP